MQGVTRKAVESFVSSFYDGPLSTVLEINVKATTITVVTHNKEQQTIQTHSIPIVDRLHYWKGDEGK